ncbi:hypothetical protein SLA2020_197650 [Shorea laevis]
MISGILPGLSMIISGSLGIDLSRNNMEGPLPLPAFPHNATFINLSKKKVLWFNFSSLGIVNLANNQLFEKIPSSIGSLYQLETFNLRDNSFSGEIPWSLGNCSALQFVDLSYNRFLGIIPAWIGERLRSLAFLLLRSNDFALVVMLLDKYCAYGSLQQQSI